MFRAEASIHKLVLIVSASAAEHLATCGRIDPAKETAAAFAFEEGSPFAIVEVFS